MKEALDFLRENNEVAFATVGEGNRPQIRVFQIMKMEDTTLWFATGPRKRVYAELQVNPAVEILSRNGNVSVRMSGDAVFDVPDEICRQIYAANPVLPRLYADYKDLVYFRVEIDRLDYYDLTPTPAISQIYPTNCNPCGPKLQKT